MEKSWFRKIGVNYRHFSLGSHSWLSLLLKFQPFWFGPWWNKAIIMHLKSIQVGDFDHVQVEGTQLLYLAKHLPNDISNSYVAYDVSFVSFQRRLQNENNPLKRAAHTLRLFEIYLFEKFYIPLFDRVVAVSKTDSDYLSNHFGINNIKVIPNGIESLNFLQAPPKSKVIRMGYIGGFTHPPNLEAVRFAIQQILPEMENNCISYELILCGEQDPQLIDSLVQDCIIVKGNIRVLGLVQHLEEFYSRIDFLLAPIFSGSGTRIKILESLSFGRPVLTTNIGAEGLGIDSPYLKKVSSLDEKDPVAWRKGILSMKYATRTKLDERSLEADLKKFLWGNVLRHAL